MMRQRLTTAAIALAVSHACVGATTINVGNRQAYGANVGWIDWRGDDTHGAVIGDFYCSGYLYGADIGWIHLGDGSPADGTAYANDSATDYGVNHDGLGNLRGHAYSANTGWVNFEDQGAPALDFMTGKMSGYAYGANIGWISLSNAYAHVQTDSLDPGADSEPDGIPDAWELKHTNTLAVLSQGVDSDGDGANDDEEYGADTDPFDKNDTLRITCGCRKPHPRHFRPCRSRR